MGDVIDLTARLAARQRMSRADAEAYESYLIQKAIKAFDPLGGRFGLGFMLLEIVGEKLYVVMRDPCMELEIRALWRVGQNDRLHRLGSIPDGMEERSSRLQFWRD